MPRSSSLTDLLAVLALLSPGCGGGGSGGGTEASLSFTFGGPSELSVDATAMTFVLDGRGLSSVSLVAPSFRAATEHAGRFYLWGVPLSPGDSELRFEGVELGGKHLARTLSLHNSPFPSAAVSLRLDPQRGVPGQSASAEIAIRTDLDAVEVLLDVDGDGQVELSAAPGTDLEFTLPQEGHYKPRVTIRTPQGMYYSSDPVSSPRLSSLPAPLPADEWFRPAGLERVVDAEYEPGNDEVWVLGGAPATLFRFGAGGALRSTHPIPEVSEPGGFCLAPGGDVYVCDRGRDRILRLQASSGLTWDTSFGVDGFLGQSGQAPGQLDSPSDVALVEDRTSDSVSLCISDTGNDRLQIFGLDGRLLREIRGDDSDPLSKPRNVTTLVTSAVVVACPEQGRIRVFSSQGEELPPLGRAAPGHHAPSPTCVSLEHTTMRAVFHDGSKGEAVICESDAEIVRRIPVPGSVTSILTIPRAGKTLLVVGRSGPASSALEVLSLPEDPVESCPNEVVRGFYAALLAGRLDQLEYLTTPPLYEKLLVLAGDPAAWAELRSLAAQLQTCETTFQGEQHAGVVCGFATPEGWVSAEQGLVRAPYSGRWKVHGS